MWIIQYQLVTWALVAYHPGGDICQHMLLGMQFINRIVFNVYMSLYMFLNETKSRNRIQLMFLIFANDNVVVVKVRLYGLFCTVRRN